MWRRPNTKSLRPNLKRVKQFWKQFGAAHFCFYCGVDSKPLIFLFLGTMGIAVLGSVLIFLWSLASGQWASEKAKYKILEAESDEPRKN